MNKILIIAVSTLLILGTACKQVKKLNYPETKKTDVVDTYFGTEVADPYRWLEDDNSEETKAWVQAQEDVTKGYLNEIPYREKIKSRLTEIWDYPKVSAPFKSGGVWFKYKNEGLQAQSVLYKLENPEDEGEVFIDPNKLSEDGTVSLGTFGVSDDGKYFAYGISRGGSDWKEFFVKDMATGQDLDDHIQWVKFSGISWYKDGFFYSRYPKPENEDVLKGENKNNKIYYHKIGTPQSEDKLFYEDPSHPDWGFGAYLTEDRSYMIINVTESTSGNALYIKDMRNSKSPIVKVIENFEKDHWVMDHHDGKLLVMTNYEAPNYRLMAIDPANSAIENWTNVIPEKTNVFKGISIIGNKMIATYLQDARSKVEVYDMHGSYLYDIDFGIGSVGGFGGKKEDTYTFYTVSGFTNPSTIYKYDVETNTSEFFDRSKIDFDPEKYETKQVFYTSKDGTKVPMFLVYKKGLELDGNNPTLLYGYGGFNVSMGPGFRTTALILLEQGGIFAVANIRGGGEYGEKWHMAGTKMKKQNVFDDFIAAGEYLIKEGYTSKKKLGIQGGSNGGLLIGACMTQRPDLFAVALPQVGVLDMLRYHKFTIGRYWATDYGTSEESKEMFDYLLNYSPLHNIKNNIEYPATMIFTADHDDRVVPAHSFKFAAELQDKYKGNTPMLIRIESKAGHGAGTSTQKVIEQYADLWTFFFQNTNHTPKY